MGYRLYIYIYRERERERTGTLRFLSFFVFLNMQIDIKCFIQQP